MAKAETKTGDGGKAGEKSATPSPESPQAGATAPAVTTPTAAAQPAATEPPADPGEGYRYCIQREEAEPIYTNNPRYAKSHAERGAMVTDLQPTRSRR